MLASEISSLSFRDPLTSALPLGKDTPAHLRLRGKFWAFKNFRLRTAIRRAKKNNSAFGVGFRTVLFKSTSAVFGALGFSGLVYLAALKFLV